MPLTAPRNKQPAHFTKKRQAGHHRKTKQYHQPYWPYLPIIGILVIGFVVDAHLTRPAILGASSNLSAQRLLADTNQARSDDNKSALMLNAQLQTAAQAKAEDMVKYNYWAHNSPAGQTPWSFITSSGYQYQSAGENLAYGFNDADDVTKGWLQSPEHKANVLGTDYQDVGFGVVQASDFMGKGPQTIVVAEYGRPVAAAANISFTVNNPPQVAGVNQELPAQKVARIQLITDSATGWSVIAVSALTGAALMLFVLRNGFRIQRWLNEGEAFVVHHPYIDVTFVLLFTIGYVLTRSSGFIR